MAETDELLEDLRPELFQEGAGLFIAPIRHHSPACAWAVRAMIEEIRPRHVLIEAPVDFEPLIDLLLDEETVPPVAIVALVEQKAEERRATGYYPFCAHSPEFVAMQAARTVGASIGFIDLPSADKTLLKHMDTGEPVSLADDTHFGSGAYIRAVCREYGCRDGFELWDHLFEARLGQPDWRSFFADVGVYCASQRAATPPGRIDADGDTLREVHMAGLIHKHARSGLTVAVVGGFHAPALLRDTASPPLEVSSSTLAQAKPYLIRYSFRALDALNGYGAGLPQPGYYQELWQRAEAAAGPPDWRQTALDLSADFTRRMREEGHLVSVPALVELLRSSETLAFLRGRPGPMRHDLFDAVRTALVKGEASPRDPWTERLATFLSGTAIGNIPLSAGSPPLVEGARNEARRNRVDVSDGARRRRKLDIHRNPAHRKASQFFHAMTLLSTGFADREAGPDFLRGIDIERLFEEWSYAWSPQVESRLIELSVRGDQLKEACLAEILHLREALVSDAGGQDIAAFVDLLADGILAGIGDLLIPYTELVAGDIQRHADFVAVGRTLQRLFYITQSKGPMGAPEGLDLSGLAGTCYRHMIYLCDSLKDVREENRGPVLEALRLVADLLSGDAADLFDRDLFDEAMDRLATSGIKADILGGVLAIAVQTGRRSEADLLAALAGNLNGASTDLVDRLGVLRGLLMTAPSLLWQSRGVLEAVDRFLCALGEDDFVALLPHVRLAFAALNPREIDLLAGLLSRLHGGTAADYSTTISNMSEEEMREGLALDARVKAALAEDGLSAWLTGRTAP